MGTPRFTPEFKEEAVRQITERGYSVAEVSDRLGVSAHSLYKWLTKGVCNATFPLNKAALKSYFGVQCTPLKTGDSRESRD
ncbi:hypothetical protein NUBL22008_44980 [Klebsiella pneumoniae]|nr:hypothetical protein NUBL22008_44980 [Klebsiella pneumoniae]SXU57527.1 ISEc14 transposase A [Klebsiella pneumoniae]